jgi:hypothetical protein
MTGMFVFAAVFMNGCAKPVTQEELIEEAVRLRVDQWRRVQVSDCRSRAMQKADAFVDSVLLARSLDVRLDTIPKPVKPDRPGKPAFRAKPDTVTIRKADDEGR